MWKRDDSHSNHLVRRLWTLTMGYASTPHSHQPYIFRFFLLRAHKCQWHTYTQTTNQQKNRHLEHKTKSFHIRESESISFYIIYTNVCVCSHSLGDDVAQRSAHLQVILLNRLCRGVAEGGWGGGSGRRGRLANGRRCWRWINWNRDARAILSETTTSLADVLLHLNKNNPPLCYRRYTLSLSLFLRLW